MHGMVESYLQELKEQLTLQKASQKEAVRERDQVLLMWLCWMLVHCVWKVWRMLHDLRQQRVKTTMAKCLNRLRFTVRQLITR